MDDLQWSCTIVTTVLQFCRRSQQVRYVISWWYRQIPFRVYVGWYRIYLPLSKFQKLLYPGRRGFTRWCSNLCENQTPFDMWHLPEKPFSLVLKQVWIMNREFDPTSCHLHKLSIQLRHICHTQLYQSIFFGAQIGCQSFFHGGFTSRPLAKLCFPLQSSRPPPVLETEFIGLGEGTGHWFFFTHPENIKSTQPKTYVRKSEGFCCGSLICHVNLVGGMVSGIISPSNGIFLRCSSPPPPKKWWSWQHLFRFNTEMSVGKCMKHTGYENDIHSLKNITWILFGDSHT